MMTIQNGVIWIDGKQATWSDAQVPIMSDSVNRALNVFDSLLACRQLDGDLRLVAGRRHVERLMGTCRAMGIATRRSVDDVLNDCLSAARYEATRVGVDEVYVRPMVIGYDLVAQDKTGSSITVAAFGRPQQTQPGQRLFTAAFRRPPNASLPPSWKATANYQLTRLSRLQASTAGYDDALLLNNSGRVAEAAGAAILAATGDELSTPPASEDCLPSITVEILERLGQQIDIPVHRRPLLLTDLYCAVGLATAGTLEGVRPVTAIDHISFTESSLITSLGEAYQVAIRGGHHHETAALWGA